MIKINEKIFPKVTIAILSWNRMYYLKATLESARKCIQYPNLEWIVLDNCSEEKGLREYLDSIDWIDQLIFVKSTHIEAMNEVVQKSTGEFIIIWPEDVQFVVKGDWLKDCVEILENNNWIGSMNLNFLSSATNKNIFSLKRFTRIKHFVYFIKEIFRYDTAFRLQKKIKASRGMNFRTYGWTADGIIGSGIPSLSRKSMWQKIGPWKSTEKRSIGNIIDSSLGGEFEMLRRWKRSNIPWQRATPIIPFAADIINDDIGTKAKVRGKNRYGVYTPPKNGIFYYQIKNQEDIIDYADRNIPVGFEEFVEPIGFDLPKDKNGTLKKAPINTSIISEIR